MGWGWGPYHTARRASRRRDQEVRLEEQTGREGQDWHFKWLSFVTYKRGIKIVPISQHLSEEECGEDT